MVGRSGSTRPRSARSVAVATPGAVVVSAVDREDVAKAETAAATEETTEAALPAGMTEAATAEAHPAETIAVGTEVVLPEETGAAPEETTGAAIEAVREETTGAAIDAMTALRDARAADTVATRAGRVETTATREVAADSVAARAGRVAAVDRVSSVALADRAFPVLVNSSPLSRRRAGASGGHPSGSRPLLVQMIPWTAAVVVPSRGRSDSPGAHGATTKKTAGKNSPHAPRRDDSHRATRSKRARARSRGPGPATASSGISPR